MELALEVVELDLEDTDLVEAVPVLRLALGQRALLNLDLLVQERELVITPNQLRACEAPLPRSLDLGVLGPPRRPVSQA